MKAQFFLADSTSFHSIFTRLSDDNGEEYRCEVVDFIQSIFYVFNIFIF